MPIFFCMESAEGKPDGFRLDSYGRELCRNHSQLTAGRFIPSRPRHKQRKRRSWATAEPKGCSIASGLAFLEPNEQLRDQAICIETVLARDRRGVSHPELQATRPQHGVGA